MYGYVYKTTNLLSHKIYIGAHVSEEFDPHYYGSNAEIIKELIELGKYNFEVVILARCNTLEELRSQEKELIQKFLDDGYNLYNKLAVDYGISHRDYSSENNPFYNGKFSQECLDHLSEVRKNLRWINKDGVETTVPSEDILDYLNHGWNLGRINLGDFSKDHTGDIWVTNGDSDHLVSKENAEDYFKLGFHKGRTKGYESAIGSVWMTNGESNRRVKSSDIEDALKEGFWRGMTHWKG